MKWSKQQLKMALKGSIPLAIIFLCIWGFVEISDEILDDELRAFDETLIDLIQGPISGPVTNLAIFLTHLGDLITLVCLALITIIFLVFQKRSVLALFVGISSLLGGAFNWILKTFFARERPTIEVLIEQGGYSFPSGHSMGALIFYGSLAIVVILVVNKLSVGILFATLSAIVIFLIGLSRVYLGVHFPSDVLAGFAIGAAWLTICFSLYLVYQTRRS